MPFFAKNSAANPATTLTPARRLLYALLAVGCIVCLPLMATLRLPILLLAVQLGLLSVLAFLHWRWLKGSFFVFAVCLITFLSTMVAIWARAEDRGRTLFGQSFFELDEAALNWHPLPYVLVYAVRTCS
jgi:uncharacterized membrane protein